MFDMVSPARRADATGWLDDLNPEQLAAATHPGGPLRILAGAGTGKTTTLCARAAWLISGGATPERIMLLTSTRRAAREMLQRTRALVPMAGGAGGVLGGTFHSVAHRFVRMHAASLGLLPGFAVLDAGDAADLLDLIREEPGPRSEPPALSPQEHAARRLLPDGQRRPDAVGGRGRELSLVRGPHRDDRDVAQGLHGGKRALGVLDLDDLLLYWRALTADEMLGPTIESGFDHVLIDEYQDVNGLQVDIVRGLRRRCDQIPFVKYGGLRYLEAAHVKDLIALFRLVDNPANELSWFRVLQLLEGVGPVTARRVLDVLVSGAGEDPLAAWEQARERLPTGAHECADGLIGALRSASSGQRPRLG